jgi:hypothetical protein
MPPSYSVGHLYSGSGLEVLFEFIPAFLTHCQPVFPFLLFLVMVYKLVAQNLKLFRFANAALFPVDVQFELSLYEKSACFSCSLSQVWCFSIDAKVTGKKYLQEFVLFHKLVQLV